MRLVRLTPPSSGFLSLAPVVNVVLLLLLFFLLGSSFVLQPGIGVTLPTSRFQMAPLVDAQIISILPGSPPRIYFQDVPVTQESLGERLSNYAGGNRSIIIRADRGVPYDTVVAVSSRALEKGFNVVLATAPEPAAKP